MHNNHINILKNKNVGVVGAEAPTYMNEKEAV